MIKRLYDFILMVIGYIALILLAIIILMNFNTDYVTYIKTQTIHPFAYQRFEIPNGKPLFKIRDWQQSTKALRTTNKKISKKTQMDTNVTLEQAYHYFIDMGMIHNLKDVEQEMVIALINRIIFLDAQVEIHDS